MTRHFKRNLMTASLVPGFLLLVVETAGAQCAMCRSALTSPEGQLLVSAFRASIVLLLATPIVSFATVALLAVRRQRRRGSVRDSQ
jgi:hypothetical protein